MKTIKSNGIKNNIKYDSIVRRDEIMKNKFFLDKKLSASWELQKNKNKRIFARLKG